MISDSLLRKKVIFEGKQVNIGDLPDSYYFVKLAEHKIYTPPRVRNAAGVCKRIADRGWKDMLVEVDTANLNLNLYSENERRKP